jgi:WD40 repeat protein
MPTRQRRVKACHPRHGLRNREVILRQILLVSFLSIASAARAEVLFTDVDRAVQRGVAFLKQKQDLKTGQWKADLPNGIKSAAESIDALCTLALLRSGLDVDDIAVFRGLRRLRGCTDLKTTYAVALQTLALCAGEPKYDAVLLQRNVDWLEKAQVEEDSKNKWVAAGSWSYSNLAGTGDGSNSRFAVLALHEARRAGAKVAPATWRRIAAYYLKQQIADGSWGYFSRTEGTGSMTSAALAGLTIVRAELPADDPALKGSDAALANGLRWLSSHFSAKGNPPATVNALFLFYYLHTLAQYGHYSGHYFIGEHAWWKEGAKVILHEQKADGSWKGMGTGEDQPVVATSLALLFLAESLRAPELGEMKGRPRRESEPPAPSPQELAEASAGRQRLVIPIPAIGNAYVRFSPDGRLLASCGLTRWVSLWDPGNGTLVRELPYCIQDNSPAFSPDGKTMALVDVNLSDTVALWDVRGSASPRTFNLPGVSLKNPSISRDGRLLLAVTDSPGCALWDVKSGKLRAIFKARAAMVYDAQFSPDGKTVAAINLVKFGEKPTPRIVQLWDVDSQRERAVLNADADWSMAFSPGGNTLAIASKDRAVRLWDTATGRLKATCRGHVKGVGNLAFSPDGTVLASSGRDRFIELWDSANGAERAVLFGHRRQVESIAFTPDGRFLASAGADKTVRLWDVHSHRLAAVLRLEADANVVTFSPDGKTLVTSSDDWRIRLWNFDKVLAAGEALEPLVGRPEERSARAMIEALGGKVYTGREDYVRVVSFQSGLFELPEDYRFVDGDLKLLRRFPHLESLTLQFTRITDAGLAELRGLRELTAIDLYADDIGDAGLKRLMDLPKLETLGLGWTKVDDAGLDHIVAMKHLKTVKLGGSRMTAEGVKRLRQRRPDLKVEWSEDKEDHRGSGKSFPKLRTVALTSWLAGPADSVFLPI